MKIIHKIGLIFIILTLACANINAEAFGNNALSVPKIGMTFFDNNLTSHKKPWGIKYHWTLGTSFKKAIDYRWWWVAESNFGMGSLTNMGDSYISSLQAATGVRLNLLDSDLRPYASLMLNYLHFLGDNVKKLPLDLDWPIWIGLKPNLGLEWFFYSEMALLLEGGYAFYVNIKEPYRHAFNLDASFMLYF